MQNYWEKWALSKGKSTSVNKSTSLTKTDPENLLVMLRTWQNGDISKQPPYNGDFEKALASIQAKALVLPSKTDLYFPYVETRSLLTFSRRFRLMKVFRPEDSEYEVSCMRPGIGMLDVFPSIWGRKSFICLLVLE